MFDEAQLYSPVTDRSDGSVEVHLAPDHPGAQDPEYRRRREEIAGPAHRWRPGDPVPTVEYTEEENAIWAQVSRELAPKHERLAVRAYLEGKEALGLPTADVFWFTIEFGVMWEDGELRAYGAGLLSSYGEIEEFRGADVRPVDFHAMATQDYDITHYQPVLFACDGMGELTDRVGGFFADFDDETPARLAAAAAA